MRSAATRSLGVLLAVLAAGLIARVIAESRHADESTAAPLLIVLAIAVLIGWLGSVAFRRAPAIARALFVVIACLAAATAAYQPQIFAAGEPVHFTAQETAALDYLRTAGMLEEPHIGYGAVDSRGWIAMRVLARSLNADAAFKDLLARGTLAGQIYGLIGVRRTDPAFYRLAARRYADSDAEVLVLGGCVPRSDRVAKLVHDAGTIDIDGGGYSSMMLDPTSPAELEARARGEEASYLFTRP
jgi:hypothetical protein